MIKRLLAFQRQTFIVPEVSHCDEFTTGIEGGAFPSVVAHKKWWVMAWM